ncbi:MAG: hypothetical protein H7124_07055 [Phycisphaerales bacterium]|nr:hypothetical protein [Hyphomonadaceae bacterium]
MKVLLLIVAVLFSFSVAHAQSGNWTDERGAFTVAVPANWVAGEGRIPVSGDKLLVIQSQAMIDHVPEPRTFFAQECSIGRILHPEMAGDQAALNAMLEDGRLLEFVIRMAFPTREHSRANEVIQGVRVVSYDLEIDVARGPLAVIGRVVRPDAPFPEVGPYRMMMRMFQLREADGAAQYIMVCQAYPLGDAANELDEMAGFLASLSFNSAPKRAANPRL